MRVHCRQFSFIQAWGQGYIATSEDGLNWGNKTLMPAGRWDSHLNVQQVSESGKWVAYAHRRPNSVASLAQRR
eukprot:COSAG06_NODE_723_length_12799_cov_3.060157_7_plen_73_part_00